MRVQVTPERTSDLLYNAEQLLDDLRNAGLREAQFFLREAVTELRRQVREESGDE